MTTTNTKTVTVVSEYTATVESRTSYEVPADLDITMLGPYPNLTLSTMPGVRPLAVTDEIVSGSESNHEHIGIESETGLT